MALTPRQRTTLAHRVLIVKRAEKAGLTPEILLQRYANEPTTKLRYELASTFGGAEALYVLRDTWNIPMKLGHAAKGVAGKRLGAPPDGLWAATATAVVLYSNRNRRASRFRAHRDASILARATDQRRKRRAQKTVYLPRLSRSIGIAARAGLFAAAVVLALVVQFVV